MNNLQFLKNKETSLTFIKDLMEMLKQVPRFSDKGLIQTGDFYPSFRIGYREYSIVNKTNHVIIQPKYFYHEDGSYTNSKPPKKIFHSAQNAFEYLTTV